MPPIPVVPLRSIVLPMVFTIRSVLFRQVAPVGTVFVVIPVVVITMVAIVDAYLNSGFLRFGPGHDGNWGSNDRSQKK
jgi:hypothetical protein